MFLDIDQPNSLDINTMQWFGYPAEDKEPMQRLSQYSETGENSSSFLTAHEP